MQIINTKSKMQIINTKRKQVVYSYVLMQNLQ